MHDEQSFPCYPNCLEEYSRSDSLCSSQKFWQGFNECIWLVCRSVLLRFLNFCKQNLIKPVCRSCKITRQPHLSTCMLTSPLTAHRPECTHVIMNTLYKPKDLLDLRCWGGIEEDCTIWEFPIFHLMHQCTAFILL